MTTQAKIWTMERNFVVPQYYNKLKVFEEEKYALLKVCLEEKPSHELFCMP
jgi:hypothetical protein